jgi:glycine hydroxymethyltransferase
MASKVFKLIDLEKHRQVTGLEMIPSENYVSPNVLKALGSILTNKYSEGFPHARYYGGNEVIDMIEDYCRDLANKLFGTKGAIVQPYSGSPANLAIYAALLNPGDKVMGLSLTSGGHLTHGSSVSYTGKWFKSFPYEVEANGKIDMKKVQALVKRHKPKLIWCGFTAYPYIIDWAGFSKIAKESGAYLAADISHISGLVIGGVHPSPVPYVHIVMTTTHKTLRGPRGAMILVTDKGLKKDPDLTTKLEKAIFPGLQGGPHNHQTAAIAVALEEALTPDFKKYAVQIAKNAAVLAKELNSYSENHLVLLDLRKEYGEGLGYQAQVALEEAGITVNKNTVPGETSSPFYPSGIRLGTPALTSRGMNEKDMKVVAGFIRRVLEEIRGHDLPKVQEERKPFIQEYKLEVKKNKKLAKIKTEVEKFTRAFPVPGI